MTRRGETFGWGGIGSRGGGVRGEECPMGRTCKGGRLLYDESDALRIEFQHATSIHDHQIKHAFLIQRLTMIDNIETSNPSSIFFIRPIDSSMDFTNLHLPQSQPGFIAFISTDLYAIWRSIDDDQGLTKGGRKDGGGSDEQSQGLSRWE